MFTRAMRIATGALLVGVTAASAQDHRASITAFAGSAAYSGLAAGAADELVLEPGAFFGAHAELFFGRLGLRLGTGYASPSLENDASTGVKLLTGDANLVWRLRRPYPGTFFQPYAVLGGGLVRYQLDGDASGFGAALWEEDPATRGTVVLGIGTDLGGGPVAVRLELSDIIGLSSPVRSADRDRFGPVQHVVLTFGLSLRGGSLGLPPRPEPRPVAIGPSPRPRPVPPRATTPQPPSPPSPRPAPPRTEPAVDDDVPDVTRPAPPVTIPSGPRPDPNVVAPPRTEPGTVHPDPNVATPPVTQPEPTPEPTPTPTPDPAPQPEPAPEPEPAPRPAPAPPPVVDDSTWVRGRLFTVRVAWDAQRPAEVRRAAMLAIALEDAGVPALPADSASAASGAQRWGAWRNADDAKRFGEYVESAYDLDWEWVHIEKDERMTTAVVAASHAFVDALGRSNGKPKGRAAP